MVLLDTTNKSYDQDRLYVPEHFNPQLNAVCRSSAKVKTVLPMPCRAHTGCSGERCFTRTEVKVHYSQVPAGKISYFTYRVLAQDSFARSIIPTVPAKAYIKDICFKNYCIVAEDTDLRLKFAS